VASWRWRISSISTLWAFAWARMTSCQSSSFTTKVFITSKLPSFFGRTGVRLFSLRRVGDGTSGNGEKYRVNGGTERRETYPALRCGVMRGLGVVRVGFCHLGLRERSRLVERSRMSSTSLLCLILVAGSASV